MKKIKNDKHEEKDSPAGEELSHIENQLKRALADYQNLEKRIAGEKSVWIKIANKDLLLKLLPGLDSLILAEAHTNDEGVKLSIKHFLDTLAEVGVTKIETVDKDFDPKFMEAVATIEGTEGKVIEETRQGYVLFDTILRPAQVVVGSAKQNQEL